MKITLSPSLSSPSSSTAKILITCATLAEAHHTIERLEAQKNLINPSLWSFSQGDIVITGIGMLATVKSLTPLVGLYQEVWNLGIAGALNPSFSAESFLSVASISKFVCLPSALENSPAVQFHQDLFPRLSSQNPQGVRLLSTDIPIHDPNSKNWLQKEYDLVDMEGYAIAWICTQENVSYRIDKIVSDLCNPDGPSTIQALLPRLSAQISRCVQERLSSLPTL